MSQKIRPNNSLTIDKLVEIFGVSQRVIRLALRDLVQYYGLPIVALPSENGGSQDYFAATAL